MSGNFFDSNIPIYLLGTDPIRARRAEEMLAQGGTISVQILSEIAAVARRKLHLGWPRLEDFLDELQRIVAVVPVTLAVHELGFRLAARHNFYIYDAMVVAAAIDAGCTILYSEDMQHGMRVAGQLTIVNPFV
jgi:predicted nucleic acid-binding protein